MLESTKIRYDNFVAEYAKTKWLNAAKAAREAGYSPKTARQKATQLLTIVYIQDQISKAKAKITANIELTGDRIIQEMQQIGFQDDNSLAAQDRKIRALDLLGKVKGIYELDNLQIAEAKAKLSEKERLESIRIANIRLKQG